MIRYLCAFILFPGFLIAQPTTEIEIESSAPNRGGFLVSREISLTTTTKISTYLFYKGREFTINDGACFLTYVDGIFNQPNDFVRVYVQDSNKQWFLQLRSPMLGRGGSVEGLSAGIRCMVFP